MGNARLLKNFRFAVFKDSTLTDQLIACSEISGGFEIKNNYATYRPGNAPNAWPMQIFCNSSPSNITFKYGMASTENLKLSNWVSKATSVNGDTKDRMSATAEIILNFNLLTVVLYKDDGKSIGAKWEIINAYPVSCKGPTLNANNAELAFEEIEICHEGIRRVEVE